MTPRIFLPSKPNTSGSKRTGRSLFESRGAGVRKILEAGKAHSTRHPNYELFGEELRLTVWASTR